MQQVFADEVPVIWIDHLGGVEGVAADPTVHGIDRSVFPDGTQGYGFLGGSFFSWEDVWIG